MTKEECDIMIGLRQEVECLHDMLFGQPDSPKGTVQQRNMFQLLENARTAIERHDRMRKDFPVGSR